MRGHVRKRGDKWCVVIDVGHLEDGRRKQQWLSGYRTRGDAQRALAEAMSRMTEGRYVEPSKLTLGRFLKQEWLPAMKFAMRASTWESYATNVEKQIVPSIGAIALQRLTPGRLNAFYGELLENGRRDGRGGLSPKTVRNIHIILHRALSDAVRWNLISRNVAGMANPPTLAYGPGTAMNTWSAEELRRFLDHVSADRLYAVYVLAASTGMRRGEVLGLRWKDLNFEASRLSIRQTLLSVNNEVRLSTPKTARGRRSVALDSMTLAVLRAHRSRQLEERLAHGADYEDLDLVFARADGRPVHPETVSQAFERRVRSAGLPRIRFHDLRHTHATLALAAGVHPKVVSERLGHATVAFTMDVYSHAIPALQAEAAETVAALIFRPDSAEA